MHHERGSFYRHFHRRGSGTVISRKSLQRIFEALFGDAAEGAFDIRLAFKSFDEQARTLIFELQLHQRPGKCLACNLTYGLPEVFSRHPMINLNGLTKEIDTLMGDLGNCTGWRLGTTDQVSSQMHSIPLLVSLS